MATSCRSCQIAREIYKHFLKACVHIQTVKSLSISGAEALKIHPGRLERLQPLAGPMSALTGSSGNRKKDVNETDEYHSPTVSERHVCVCDCVRVWRNSVEISNYQGGVWKGLSALEYADWAEGKNISEMVRFVCASCCMWVVICSELCNTYAIENKTLELQPSGSCANGAYVGKVSSNLTFPAHHFHCCHY